MKTQIGNYQTHSSTWYEMDSHVQHMVDNNTPAIEITKLKPLVKRDLALMKRIYVLSQSKICHFSTYTTSMSTSSTFYVIYFFLYIFQLTDQCLCRLQTQHINMNNSPQTTCLNRNIINHLKSTLKLLDSTWAHNTPHMKKYS